MRMLQRITRGARALHQREHGAGWERRGGVSRIAHSCHGDRYRADRRLMPRRAIIDLRAMLREFGYDPERMTHDARTSAATRIIKRHTLEHFAMPGKC